MGSDVDLKPAPNAFRQCLWLRGCCLTVIDGDCTDGHEQSKMANSPTRPLPLCPASSSDKLSTLFPKCFSMSRFSSSPPCKLGDTRTKSTGDQRGQQHRRFYQCLGGGGASFGSGLGQHFETQEVQSSACCFSRKFSTDPRGHHEMPPSKSSSVQPRDLLRI